MLNYQNQPEIIDQQQVVKLFSNLTFVQEQMNCCHKSLLLNQIQIQNEKQSLLLLNKTSSSLIFDESISIQEEFQSRKQFTQFQEQSIQSNSFDDLLSYIEGISNNQSFQQILQKRLIDNQPQLQLLLQQEKEKFIPTAEIQQNQINLFTQIETKQKYFHENSFNLKRNCKFAQALKYTRLALNKLIIEKNGTSTMIQLLRFIRQKLKITQNGFLWRYCQGCQQKINISLRVLYNFRNWYSQQPKNIRQILEHDSILSKLVDWYHQCEDQCFKLNFSKEFLAQLVEILCQRAPDIHKDKSQASMTMKMMGSIGNLGKKICTCIIKCFKCI